MNKKMITSERLPATGPYSPGVETGGFIFISGQLPVNPDTGEIVKDIQQATRQVLNNIRNLLDENGLSLSDIVKTTIFLKSMKDFNAFNEIYAGFFSTDPPARSTVEVSNLPKGAPLEIEAVAVRKANNYGKDFIC